jgi:hypothetical protein
MGNRHGPRARADSREREQDRQGVAKKKEKKESKNSQRAYVLPLAFFLKDARPREK